MNKLQSYTNNFAISLSLICAIHCLAFPFLLLLLPSVAAMQLDNEAFHMWLLLAVIPSSVYSLIVGCRKHKRYQLLILGVIGLVFMIAAVVIGGEVFEKVATLSGAAILAVGHFLNYRLCRTKSCGCTDGQH